MRWVEMQLIKKTGEARWIWIERGVRRREVIFCLCSRLLLAETDPQSIDFYSRHSLMVMR